MSLTLPSNYEKATKTSNLKENWVCQLFNTDSYMCNLVRSLLPDIIIASVGAFGNIIFEVVEPDTVNEPVI